MTIYEQTAAAIKELGDFQNCPDQISLFEKIRAQAQPVLKSTLVCRKAVRFILSSLKGLIDGYEEFSPDEISEEVSRILECFETILDSRADYQRNSIFRAPAGKSYLDLAPSHFTSLARFRGYGKVLQNLINLKIEDPSKIAWADAKIDFLVASRDSTQQKGSLKDQLSDLQSIDPSLSAETKKGDSFLGDRILSDRAEGFATLKSLKHSPKSLLDADTQTGIVITTGVLGGFFTKTSLKEFSLLGYQVDPISASYIVIYNAKLFGAHSSLFKPKYIAGNKVQVGDKIGHITRMMRGLASILFSDNTKSTHPISAVEVIEYNSTVTEDALERKMISMLDKKYFRVGKPVLCGDHYYWLCLENSLKDIISARMWGFPRNVKLM